MSSLNWGEKIAAINTVWIIVRLCVLKLQRNMIHPKSAAAMGLYVRMLWVYNIKHKSTLNTDSKIDFLTLTAEAWSFLGIFQSSYSYMFCLYISRYIYISSSDSVWWWTNCSMGFNRPNGTEWSESVGEASAPYGREAMYLKAELVVGT